jgi:hypothetical protein
MGWQKRIRRKLRFIFVCKFCYKNLQIRKLFSELRKTFVHKHSWVFTQDVRFCCRTATTAAARLRNTKCCAGWRWQPALYCCTGTYILPPSSTQFLKMKAANGCPHNVFTAVTRLYKFVSVNVCINCQLFRPFLSTISGPLRWHIYIYIYIYSAVAAVFALAVYTDTNKHNSMTTPQAQLFATSLLQTNTATPTLI